MPATPPRLELDIVSQPTTLAGVVRHHQGLGRESMLAAAALVAAAPRVVITGMGASLNAAIVLEYLLSAHGKEALVVEAGELLHYRSAVYKDATFVVVSRSGESVEIAKWLTANAGSRPVIGVTNVPDSTLGRAAEAVLDTHSLPDEMVAIQTYSATLVTLYMAGMAAFGRFDAACREIETLLPTISRLISEGLTERRGWDDFLQSPAPVYVLGRGASCSSVYQGALLFGEVAKAPAVGMPVASFRHGPIEVVDRRFKALVLAPQGATRPLNLALAQDIVRFGGNVRVIGPPLQDHAALSWVPLPPCPELLAPLLEAVPLQVAAMRLAELNGIKVGSFRFTPQVARDESAFIA